LRANADPFAERPPEELDRQVRIGIRDDPGHSGSRRPGFPEMTPRGQLWSRRCWRPRARHGLGVTLAMAPLIKARPGFGRKLVAPFDIETGPVETIYLVSRTELARAQPPNCRAPAMDRGCRRPRPPGTTWRIHSLRSGRRFE
jgi:hypothetical protein